MYAFLGKFTTTQPWLVVLAWVGLGVTASLLAPNWERNSQDDDVRFLPARCASVRGFQLLEEAFPNDVSACKLIISIERQDRPLEADDYGMVDRLVARLNAFRADHPEWKTGTIVSHRDPFLGKRLISRDGHCTLIQVPLPTPYLALQTRQAVDQAQAVVDEVLAEVLAEKGPGIATVQLTGPAGIGHDLIAASANGLEATTGATIVLVVVVLLAVHRAPLLALIPLVTIALSVWVALKLLAMATLIPGFHLVNISQIFAVVMLYGAGTDYCLFLISRYKEELAQGYDAKEALSRALEGVGHALVASAATVICGLGLMIFAEFAKMRCGGPAIAVSLSVALMASMSLTPAMLYLMGPAVFWPGKPPAAGQVNHGGIWDVISHIVVARPRAIWIASMVVLLPLCFLGLFAKPSFRATAELNPSSSSIRGMHAIQRHFASGETGPITVLLESPSAWDDPRGRDAIHRLGLAFRALPHVAEVRSLDNPLGNHETPALTASSNGMGLPILSRIPLWNQIEEQIQKTIQKHYLAKIEPVSNSVQHADPKVDSGANDMHSWRQALGEKPPLVRQVARFDIVLDCDPFDPESGAAVECLELWINQEMGRFVADYGPIRGEIVGVPVGARDMAAIVENDRLRINLMVLTGILLILWALVKKPWLALYLLGTVLLSYLATLGATVLLAHFVFDRVLGEVDWRVPFFLFVILVAVGEDYNILLMSRMLEQVRKLGPTEAMREALASTGSTITSCGLIMAGTFATLAFAGLSTLVQIGFALAFGVLLDTFIVRPFMVPAFVIWIWQGEEMRAKEEAIEASIRNVEKLENSRWREAI